MDLLEASCLWGRGPVALILDILRSQAQAQVNQSFWYSHYVLGCKSGQLIAGLFEPIYNSCMHSYHAWKHNGEVQMRYKIVQVHMPDKGCHI